MTIRCEVIDELLFGQEPQAVFTKDAAALARLHAGGYVLEVCSPTSRRSTCDGCAPCWHGPRRRCHGNRVGQVGPRRARPAA
jgi:hypothetical protein